MIHEFYTIRREGLKCSKRSAHEFIEGLRIQIQLLFFSFLFFKVTYVCKRYVRRLLTPLLLLNDFLLQYVRITPDEL